MKTTQIGRLVVVLLGMVMVGPLQAEKRQPSQEVLMAKPVTLPDNRIVARVIRVEFPMGFKTARHIHEGPGPRYVLAGKVKIIDKDGTRVYHPGEVFWETGEPMVAENAADATTVLLIFEMVPQKATERTDRIIVIQPK
jgi:quercetin dioxygenase-like cupin family protein